MNHYLEHIQNKTPHERRQHAVQISGAITAAVAVIWLGTLSLRTTTSHPVAQNLGDQTQTASVAGGFPVQQPATLQVATTTQY